MTLTPSLTTFIPPEGGGGWKFNPPLHPISDRAHPFPVVASMDPAIDTTRSDLEAYRLTANLDHLVFLPDTTPTVFWINAISTSHLMTIQGSRPTDVGGGGIDPAMSKLFSYFLFGVVQVDNLTRHTDGLEIGCLIPDVPVKGTGRMMISHKHIDWFSPEDILEVAALVEARSFLRPKTAPNFPKRLFYKLR